jgi:uncharacterized FAD-dependent dehydrogenase
LAPGALVGDFIKRQRSSAFGQVQPSYKPGVHLTDLQEPGRGSLPEYALDAIREALPAFERQIKGFSLPDAVLAGEGAGYAGGIMSAGVDGIEVAEALGAALLAR